MAKAKLSSLPKAGPSSLKNKIDIVQQLESAIENNSKDLNASWVTYRMSIRGLYGIALAPGGPDQDFQGCSCQQ